MIEKKKRGRPPTPPNSRRSIVRKIALTPPEDARIRRDAEAMGLSLSDLIRNGALNYRRLTRFAATVQEQLDQEG